MYDLPPRLETVGRTLVRWRGRELVCFSGCDYFRLSSDPAVVEAACGAARKFGLGVAASRRTTGNHPLYEELEEALAKFFGAEGALLVSNGYATGMAVAQACLGGFSEVLVDERAHGCIADVAPLFGAEPQSFAHRSAEDAALKLARVGADARVVLLTDGMFAHDGSIAPLAEYRRALPAGAWLVVDDAHGAGVLGARGRGTRELAGVGRRDVIQLVTLSKAFGASGGAVLGPRGLLREIVRGSAAFVGSTPPPLPMAAAALAALRRLGEEPELRARLAVNSALLKRGLRDAGWAVEATPGPVVAVLPQSAGEAEALKRRLLAKGIFPPFIRYPGGPDAGYFRCAVSSEHTAGQIERFLAAMDLRRREGGKAGQREDGMGGEFPGNKDSRHESRSRSDKRMGTSE